MAVNALLSWLLGLFSIDKAVIAGCAALALLAGWFYIAKTNAEADAAMIRADNSRLLNSAAAKDAALAALQREKVDLESIIAKRDARITELNSAAIDAATAIQGAQSESPAQDIDALWPRSVSCPLRVLEATAASRDRAASDCAAAAGNAVSAEADAESSGKNDDAQHGAMVRKNDGLGR